MKPRNKVILIITLLGIIILAAIWMFFKGASSFVSSFDGNNQDLNENRIIKNYYFVASNKCIVIKNEDIYRVAIKNVDSLCWSNDLIFGYRIDQYFSIDVSDESIQYFLSKDSLFLNINVKTLKHLNKIPSLMKQ